MDWGEARDEELGELLVMKMGGVECIGGLSWWVAGFGRKERLIRWLKYGQLLSLGGKETNVAAV